MAYIFLSARRAELTRSINELNYEKLQIQKERRKLVSFSTAIADGYVTPDELSQLNSHYVKQALNLNESAFMYAEYESTDRTNDYLIQYSGITQDEYFSNSSLMQKANLYWDPDTGDLDADMIKENLMEKLRQEFVEKCIEPSLKALEDEYEERELDIETQVASMEAELKTIDEGIQQKIQNSAIKF